MIGRRGWGLGLTLALFAASPAVGGAWTQPKGQGQVIVKAEAMRATHGFDPDGERALLPVARDDAALGVFIEYGLTERLTLQVKTDYQRGEDLFVDYDGRGPFEIGVVWQAWRNEATAVSLYVGQAWAGDGRNAGYASPGVGDIDREVRVSLGHGLQQPFGARGPDHVFVEVQAARRFRTGLADETRLDLTVGGRWGEGWMTLGQVFAGETSDRQVRWASVETSVVRRLGDWSVQAGWREAVRGRETPVSRGPMLAVWRRF